MPKQLQVQNSKSVVRYMKAKNVDTKRVASQPSVTEKALERLHQGVANLMQDYTWKQALAFKARLYPYSFFNTMLIMSQCPEASIVAGYRKWLVFGRQVKKGEKGITILAPLIFSIKHDPSETSGSIQASFSKVGSDSDASQTRSLKGFRAVYVFDVSQTEGDSVPELAKPQLLRSGLDDEPKVLLMITKLLAFSARQEISVSFDLEHSQALGCYFPKRQAIGLKSGLPALQTLKTFIHELAHALLHDLNSPRVRAELEAESCAYLVFDLLGLDSSDYSFPYLANWVESLDELLQSGEKATKAAKHIYEAIDTRFAACPDQNGEAC